MRFRAIELLAQGLQQGIGRGRLRRRGTSRDRALLPVGGNGGVKSQQQKNPWQRQSRRPDRGRAHGLGAIAGASLLAAGGAPVSNPGGARIGGRCVPLARFWTSISEKSIAGAAAATGIWPDSAPQIPLNTWSVSPVSMIVLSERSGVPTMSTPRTSSSGRPSGYMRQTITGTT